MLAVLYSEKRIRLFLLKCSCSGAAVELLLVELGVVLQHELVPGGREERGLSGSLQSHLCWDLQSHRLVRTQVYLLGPAFHSCAQDMGLPSSHSFSSH